MFQLQVWNKGESASLVATPGAAEVQVEVNAPPAVGTCASDPAVGRALSQDFRVFCTGWEDDARDFPLSYSFSRVLGDGAMVQIGSPQGSNELVTVLGPAEDPSGLIWIEGRVADRSVFLSRKYSCYVLFCCQWLFLSAQAAGKATTTNHTILVC